MITLPTMTSLSFNLKQGMRWDPIKADLKTLGAIGLDIANFGSKVGNYSYTFTKDDFFSNDKNLGGSKVKDTDSNPVYQGYFDLSVGVTDVIDTWVSTSLLVQALQLTPKGEKLKQKMVLIKMEN